jgi:ribosomal protein S27AE
MALRDDPAIMREYKRNWRKKHSENARISQKKSHAKWAKSPGYKAYLKAYRAKDIVRVRARKILNNAVARGKMRRQPCEKCGADTVEAHHDDYSKPLDVRWLCKQHHVAAHKNWGAPRVA